jgi:hypothetical protein
MPQGDSTYSREALSRSTQLVLAYTDSVDGRVTEDLEPILEAIGDDKAELRDLVASLAGLAGHAVMVIAVRLEADLGHEQPSATRHERVLEQRDEVLLRCAEALREFRTASLRLPPASSLAAWAAMRERRSGLERRLAPDRRRRPPGNSSETINLRLYGERRTGDAERRSGTERRNPPVTGDGEGEDPGRKP